MWLVTLSAAHAVTPSVGKDKLRELLKLPTIMFQQDWTFDAERGFALGSGTQDARKRMAELQSGLKGDASDAQAEEELAELCESAGDRQGAQQAWKAAADDFRKRVDSQPDDGVLLAGLGLSLEETGNAAEAESILRRAAQTEPTAWQCHVALGRFLDREAKRGVLEGDWSGGLGDRLAAAGVSTAKARLNEAGECFDEAVMLAPKQPEAWFRRAMHRSLSNLVSNEIAVATGAKDLSADIYEGCFSPESLADLQQASRLSPDNYELVGSTALFEVYVAQGRTGHPTPNLFSWRALPEKSQASLRGELNRLDSLAGGADSHAAAGALEVLGILEGPVLHEPDRCIASLQQALTLDPSREHAADVLVATLAQSGRYDELLSACEDQVKRTNSARGHLLLAKAHERLKQWDDCEDETRLAVLLEPGDFTADLSLAAMLLKHSTDGDDDTFAEADACLRRAESALGKTPPAQRNRQQVVDLTLTRGIYYALTGDMDTARQFIKAVVERDANNQFAHEILSAMDF
jgi:tetratricopeptide (TPR) repeat protein